MLNWSLYILLVYGLCSHPKLSLDGLVQGLEFGRTGRGDDGQHRITLNQQKVHYISNVFPKKGFLTKCLRKCKKIKVR